MSAVDRAGNEAATLCCVTDVGVPTGSYLPIRARKVLASGTSATDIICEF